METCTAVVSISGVIRNLMKGSIMMIRKTGMEYTHGRMEEYIRAFGMMVNSMGWQSTGLRSHHRIPKFKTIRYSMGSGKMEDGFSGLQHRKISLFKNSFIKSKKPS